MHSIHLSHPLSSICYSCAQILPKKFEYVSALVLKQVDVVAEVGIGDDAGASAKLGIGANTSANIMGVGGCGGASTDDVVRLANGVDLAYLILESLYRLVLGIAKYLIVNLIPKKNNDTC